LTVRRERVILKNDEPKSLNVYGSSKALGEKNIVKSKLERYYIIRSAWLFGPSVAVPSKILLILY